MKGNDSGRGTGLTLVLVLIVALVVAWLAVTQLRSVRSQDSAAQPGANYVQQAQDAVNALNDRMNPPATP